MARWLLWLAARGPHMTSLSKLKLALVIGALFAGGACSNDECKDGDVAPFECVQSCADDSAAQAVCQQGRFVCPAGHPKPTTECKGICIAPNPASVRGGECACTGDRNGPWGGWTCSDGGAGQQPDAQTAPQPDGPGGPEARWPGRLPRR